MASSTTSYDKIIAKVFSKRWRPGAKEVLFSKDDLIADAASLGEKVKNLPDVLFTYRNRRPLPAVILKKGNWVIAARGSGLYAFVSVKGSVMVDIPTTLKKFPIPYAVPEIVASNLAKDEQGLLTIVRYNRLLDVFTGLACFHLQSHIRTHLSKHGQVEIDDLYVGVDKNGQGYVLPVEAKDIGESLGISKAIAMTLFAQTKYPNLICRPIAVVRQAPDVISCIEFEPVLDLKKVAVLDIRCYQLVREDAK